jgi:hypothetical protein
MYDLDDPNQNSCQIFRPTGSDIRNTGLNPQGVLPAFLHCPRSGARCGMLLDVTAFLAAVAALVETDARHCAVAVAAV